MIDASVRVLLIEDNPDDAFLIQEMLTEIERIPVQFEVSWADRLSMGAERLAEQEIQAILLDLGLPDSQGIETFERVRALSPSIPIVVLSGLNDEEIAIRAVSEGAQDYLVKGEVDGRLVARAIRYAIERKEAEEERECLIGQLREALDQVQTLKGLLPICSNCKKIRDDEGYWTEVEIYILEHSQADLTHSICPECGKKLYPDYYQDD